MNKFIKDILKDILVIMDIVLSIIVLYENANWMVYTMVYTIFAYC